MGKMLQGVLLAMILEFGIFLFFNDVHTVANSSLLNLVLNPGTLSDNSLYQFFTSNLFTIAAVGSIVASLIFFKVDFPIYLSLSAVMVTWTASLIDLYLIISSRTYLDAVTMKYIAALVVGPLLIYYLMTLADFVRGRD